MGITTHPLRSTERKNHPRPRHRPNTLHHGLSTSEHHAERRARLIEQRYHHGRRTDRKTSVRPSIYRNSCGGENAHIREQEIGIQCLRHWFRLQRRGGSKLVSCCDGDAVLEAAVKDKTRCALTQLLLAPRRIHHRTETIINLTLILSASRSTD